MTDKEIVQALRICATNWDYFSRHYTCIEVERAMEGKKDG